MPKLTGKLDPQRDYWPGSPHSPKGDRQDFNNPTCGDAHLWDVWHGKKPFEWYRTCEHRFNSEFGFQSFPVPKTVYGYTEEADRNVTSWVMEHHQRSSIGNTTIMQYMLDWFRLPYGFENTLWASQILQGMAIKYACEHWRRSMPRGMGTLYWQLNDCWPVASWASIDYHGRWKALHYLAKDFFAPLLINGLEDAKTGTVEVHVTNDHLKARKVKAAWRVTDVAGNLISEGGKKVNAKASADFLVKTLDLSKSIAKYGARNLLVWLELTVDGEAEPVSRNLVLFSRPKHLELLDAKIKTSVKKAGDAYKVTLTSAAPALWAWLELTEVDAVCSTNFVHVHQGQPVEIMVQPNIELTSNKFKEQMVVKSLIDTY
jgi:beta-mannosidase